MIDDSFIDGLKNSLPQADFDILLAELKTSEDGKLKLIHDKFAGLE